MLIVFNGFYVDDGKEFDSQAADYVLSVTGWSLEEMGLIYVGF